MNHITNIKSLLLVCLVLFIYDNTNAQVYHTDNGYAEFQAKATVNDYNGVSNQLQGTINADTKELLFSVPVESIDTGIGKRNKDMHELLETNKYPNIEFKGKIISDFNPNSISPQPVTVTGDFSMHGITKSLTIEGMIHRKNGQLSIEASWDILITNYNIEPPKVLFNKVDDKHKVLIRAELERTAALTNY